MTTTMNTVYYDFWSVVSTMQTTNDHSVNIQKNKYSCMFQI